MNLSEDEENALTEARARGFYVRSGRTLKALRSWRTWCRAHGQPEVVIILGARNGSVEVNGREAWSGPRDEAEQEARQIVADTVKVAPAPQQALLF